MCPGGQEIPSACPPSAVAVQNITAIGQLYWSTRVMGGGTVQWCSLCYSDYLRGKLIPGKLVYSA